MALALPQLEAAIRAELPSDVLDSIRMHTTVHGVLVFQVETPRLLTQISVRPSGECDVDFMHMPEGQGDFRCFVFTHLPEAVSVVARELHSALDVSW